MTPQDAKSALLAMGNALTVAAMVIEQHRETMEQYLAEAQQMDSFGALLDPTLFKSRERQETGEIMTPVVQAGLIFLNVQRQQGDKARSILEARGIDP